MAVEQPSAEAVREAARQNDFGLKLYGTWEIDDAIASFTEAAVKDPENPESLLSSLHLNEVEGMIKDETISGGMIPKVSGALAALHGASPRCADTRINRADSRRLRLGRRERPVSLRSGRVRPSSGPLCRVNDATIASLRMRVVHLSTRETSVYAPLSTCSGREGPGPTAGGCGAGPPI